ncbi:gamma-glutamyltransferase 6 isoform X2 [Enhydra lutris kenyoni]|uniref:Gamma-glutamyltransferase 6 isoform X2 n=1 Tax=Enhydra lutris kenyoni TaxID=391180 RepID=A0A2Y9L2R2_ENHLU|nr:gamma-glutamyltransferase 6 isoform X2 [Enhydra lutris kenyoni]
MEPEARPVLYQQLLLWDPSLGSEDDGDDEEETSELVVSNSWRPHNSLGNEVGRLPGAWARLGAALLLLVTGFSLAARQLYMRGNPTGSQGSAAPRPGGHSHAPGVYHHGAIISPAGQKLLIAGGNVVDAGVGAALCLAVVHPHTTGLGATFWALFHNSSSGSPTALTPGPARPLAPGLRLPSALPSLRLLHARFGRLPWPRLLGGPASLAQDGFLVDTALATALAARGTKGLCPVLCHADGTPLGPGARATNPKLAAVLRLEAQAPDRAGDTLLSLLVRDLGLRRPHSRPMPTLEPAVQQAIPQGVLSITPGPSACPELLAMVGAALRSGEPGPDPCPARSPAPVGPVGTVLATVDSGGSVLLLTSSLSSPFGSGHLSPSTGVLLSDLVAKPTDSAWACPLLLHGSSDDTEADMLGLVASGTPAVARVVTRALLSHLAGPQTQVQHQRRQGPTLSTSVCGQGTLLQVAVQAEHAHVSGVPSSCCTVQGF